MPEFFEEYGKYIPYIYFALISLVAFCMVAYDKRAAKKKPKNRTPEKHLFFTAVIGGSVMMYTSMLIFRHKTKHKRFMIGLPIIMIMQFALALTLLIMF